MRIICSLATLLLSFFSLGQPFLISGNVSISMKEGSLKSTFMISKIPRQAGDLRFLLHEEIEVLEVNLNGKVVIYEKTRTECFDCQEYLIKVNQISITDKLSISTNMHFKNYDKGYKKDYKGKIISNFGILRASEQSKWYPMIVSTTGAQPLVLSKTLYDYDLQVDCKDCKQIYVGQGSPKKSGQFKGEQALEAIVLIAGDFGSKKTDFAHYINVSNEQSRMELDGLFEKIILFYEAFTGFELPTNFVYAQLPSANKDWGGFMSYPTIVNVSKTIEKEKLPAYLSHEVAHYLFGDVYKPAGPLYWFYLESFAEYMSYKYMLSVDQELIREDYEELAGEIDFVRLDQVNSYEEVTSQHRYTTGAFQLLAINRRIGDEKMLELIDRIFETLTGEANGYQVLIQSMQDIGIKEKVITSIEKELIQSFDLNQYEFVARSFARPD
ncbi:MAG: hypothetical protein ACJA0X_002835 [Cyclobacteriaceae bacterium]|jgi:hypothetical protein